MFFLIYHVCVNQVDLLRWHYGPGRSSRQLPEPLREQHVLGQGGRLHLLLYVSYNLIVPILTSST